MAFDALRGYVQLANGLTDVTRQRALQTAKQLLEHGGDVVDIAVSTATSVGFTRQAQSLADDLLATSRTNRDLLIGLVRTEVERVVARLGLVGADELAAMTRVVERLQSQLDAAIAFGGDLIQPPGHRSSRPSARPGQGEASASADTAEPGEPVARKVSAKKVPAKKAPAKKAPAKRTAGKKAPAKKTAAKQAPAKHAPGAPAPAAPAPATKAPSEPHNPDPPAPHPVTSEPVTSEPATSAPATSAPVTSAPVTSEPVTSEPVTSEPASSAPVTVPSEPVTPEPGSSRTATNEGEPA